MKIDLHMHTNQSDGADEPRDLIAKVRDAGIDVFSVTDHDTDAGSLLAEELLAEDPRGLRFIRGIEFSCKDREGKYHILGYGYDPKHPAFLDTLREVRRVRLAKAEGRVNFLKEEFGIELPEEKVQWFYSLKSPTKPVLADVMVECGLVADRDEAMRKYIDRFHHDFYLPPEKAVAGIQAAGGVAVLAHPSFGDGSQYIVGEEMEARLRRLMGFGLDGVEAFYSEFSQDLIGELLGYAEKYDLLITAGSDYHGTDHHGAMGITNLPAEDEWPAGLTRFLAGAGILG